LGNADSPANLALISSTVMVGRSALIASYCA
jgi:hypothetical protein